MIQYRVGKYESMSIETSMKPMSYSLCMQYEKNFATELRTKLVEKILKHQSVSCWFMAYGMHTYDMNHRI